MKYGGGNNGATKICGPLLDGLRAVFAKTSFSSKDVVQATSLEGGKIIIRSDLADDQGTVRFPKAGDGVIPAIKKADLGYVGWEELAQGREDVGAGSIVGINRESAGAELFDSR